MARKLIGLFVVAAVGLWSPSVVWAQGSSGNQYRDRDRDESPTLAERVDNFGRNVAEGLGNLLPFKKPSAQPQNNSSRTNQDSKAGTNSHRRPSYAEFRKRAAEEAAAKTGSSRAGSVMGSQSQKSTGDDNSAGSARKSQVTVVRPSGSSSSGSSSSGSSRTGDMKVPSLAARSPTPVASISKSTVKQVRTPGPTIPLHKRLSTFRQSTFGHAQPAESTDTPSTFTDTSVTSSDTPTTAEPTASLDQPGEAEVQSSDSDTSARAAEPAKSVAPTLAPSRPRGAARLAVPRLARRSSPTKTPAGDVKSDKPTATPNPLSPDVAVDTPAPTAKVQSAIGESVLFTQQSPILDVKTIGPRRISVGKESTYEVIIQNSGRVASEGTVVSVDLPEWADVLGAEASVGLADLAATRQETRQVQWAVGKLEAAGQERLVLKIIPRQNRPIDLAVKWNYSSVASEAKIEVQQPKVSLQLDGPREVLFGAKEVFKLELTNSGNGDAENVMVALLPIARDGSPPATHKLGTLAAGKKQTIEIEILARQTGSLTVQVELRGDDGVQAELAEQILVRRANLKVSVEGPKVQYVGSPVAYRIDVSNQGDAAAEKLKIVAAIPPGAKYLSSNLDGELGPDSNQVVWNLDSIAVGEKQSLLLQCHLGLAGVIKLDVLTTAEGDLTASATATTQVEAMADLALEVSDPAGPIAVGTDTVYELRIQNRGTKGAENIDVTAYFSQGIEPVAAEGGGYKIGAGQVTFDPIRSLPAGQDIVLKIKARAETAGNHIFRAEVYCKPLGSRLVGEETTYFFSSKAAASVASKPDSPRNDGHSAGPLR